MNLKLWILSLDVFYSMYPHVRSETDPFTDLETKCVDALRRLRNNDRIVCEHRQQSTKTIQKVCSDAHECESAARQ